ncbi:solute carrier family 26 member 6-like isoform X1 [Agrilus planipennis]|uniref:Solute carrier family 26 member 6-like isoform X1 n=1 Tax=Agrilus planipennis TaxID=224129 RepID=A0A1W4WI27_AGRPL|nr:solute carrier family 26 member 6-like isoform X1 [Agrilus planipennis]XP_025831028.1 solute carrier family 26 member 6-like isoform X1 [Agrilus planipennis]
MHMSQGMAYALLGHVPPVTGIYMAFVPLMVYAIFGTSRHCSMGTFAVVCLMTGSIVEKYANAKELRNGTVIPEGDFGENETLYTNIDVAIAVSLAVAFIQLGMFVLQMGMVANLFSEALVSGFTCGAAMHVFTSQLKELLGVPIRRRSGIFRIILVLKDVFTAIPQANAIAVTISVVCVTFLMLCDIFLKPYLAKKTIIPFPAELSVVILGTAMSYSLDLNQKRNVNIINYIPLGIPAPILPSIEMVKRVTLESIAVTIVSYAIAISMVLLLAQKVGYETDANQEILALSLSNLAGSVFQCMPVSASLSRSFIQMNTGGSTQMATLVSCLVLCMVLLWIGPLFEPLPLAILSSVVVVALRRMLLQVRDIKRFWLGNIWDGLTWIVSFFVTVIVDVSIGLAAGITVNVLGLVVRGYRGNQYILGNVPNTDLYEDIKRHKKCVEFEGLKIFRYAGCIQFLTKLRFRNTLFEAVGINPLEILDRQQRKKKVDDELENFDIYCVIVDMSSVPYVDPSGVILIDYCIKDYRKIGIEVLLACLTGAVFEEIQKCKRNGSIKENFGIFVTIHDAVIYAQAVLKK